MKSLARGQPAEEAYTCIKLHGTAHNRLDQVYEGKADLLAFETEFSFLLVNKQAFQGLVKRHVDLTK